MSCNCKEHIKLGNDAMDNTVIAFCYVESTEMHIERDKCEQYLIMESYVVL